MTNEEALKYLDEHCTASVIPFEVKELCSFALERQIPKPVVARVLTDDQLKRYKHLKPFNFYCPYCHCGVEFESNMYCPSCSQSLDWDEWEK